jgi:hypothetical protein
MAYFLSMTLFSILSWHNYLRVRAFLLAGLDYATAPFALKPFRISFSLEARSEALFLQFQGITTFPIRYYKCRIGKVFGALDPKAAGLTQQFPLLRERSI